MSVNYYLALGVTPDASGDEIRAAFRRRAMEVHPDRSHQESGPFLEVQEAYSVLGDPERRRRYDIQHAPSMANRGMRRTTAEPAVRPRPRGEPFRAVDRAGGFREVSLMESFDTYRPSYDELFDRFWGNFEAVGRPKAERLESLTVEVVVGPDEARRGGRVRVWIPSRADCPTCGGHGSVGAYECWRCEGHGGVAVEHPVEVDYPPGLNDGAAARIPLIGFGISNFYLTVLFRVS